MEFKELNLNWNLIKGLDKLKHTKPSPIQEMAIPPMLEGRDLVACAQTGTGKTAAFALPILQKLITEDAGGAADLPENTTGTGTETAGNPPGKGKKKKAPVASYRLPKLRALILTPTWELAQQIGESFDKYGRYTDLRTVCIYGGVKEQIQVYALRQGCDILVATPGRFLDFMKQGILYLQDIEVFVLDEADRMLDMGFLPDVRKITDSLPVKKQSVMFSATMPREIGKLAKDLLTDPVSVKADPEDSPAETVEQWLVFTTAENKTAFLRDYLQREEVKRSIIFTSTKEGAEELGTKLNDAGFKVLTMHGDKTQGQRLNALQRFRTGQLDALVATDVAARGIDVQKITHVFNYDLPRQPESYIHRIGRSGRAGERGISITLCCPREKALLFAVERLLKAQIPELETQWSIPLIRKGPAKPAQEETK